MRPKTKTINIVLMDGGLGDCIAALTAVGYIPKQYPWITPLVWTQDFLADFARNVLPGIDIKGYSEMRGRYDQQRTTKTTQWDGIVSPMKIHLVDYAFLKLCDENPNITHKNYLRVDPIKDLSWFSLPEKYVVVTTGFTAEVREFAPKHVNMIVQYITQKGYYPVFLGETSTKTGGRHVIEGTFKEDIDFSAGLNLVDKTSLLEAASIMDKAAAVVGVDNGLLHLAGCTDVPIVSGFTTVSPEIRNPIRNNILGWNCYNVLPDSALDCKFCQQTTNFLYGHDYKKCWYKEKKERGSISCVDQMTADKFIVELEKIL